jgi:hypothetical protein
LARERFNISLSLSPNRTRHIPGQLASGSSVAKMTIELVDEKSPTSRPKPADTPEVAPRKARSRVTNGKVLIAGVDQRSLWVRRCKDIIASHLSDLGGTENTSAAERSLIRRASVMSVELERLETKFAGAGEASDSDLDLYQRTAGNLRRLLEAVGLQRRAKQVNDMDAFLAKRKRITTVPPPTETITPEPE